jgi:hypothetical protein
LEDDAPDDFRDLRDDGVAECCELGLNQSSGNPMSHATHIGFRFPRPPETIPSVIPTERGSELC